MSKPFSYTSEVDFGPKWEEIALVLSLSDAYVIGLASDLSAVLREKEGAIRGLREGSIEVEGVLGEVLAELVAGRESLDKLEREHGVVSRRISELNGELSALHQRSGVLQVRTEEMKKKMFIVGRSDPDYRHLRRERARLLNEGEDLAAEIAGVEAGVEGERGRLNKVDEGLAPARVRVDESEAQISHLQGKIPQPGVVVELFEIRVASLNCEFFLEGDSARWSEGLVEAVGGMVRLHRELRGGRYRIDRNSEFVGGRATATGEALYGAVVIGRKEDAGELFRLACESDLFFHDIFGVFRCWCLGLYLEERFEELRTLLAAHRFSEGLREAYVASFSALLEGDSRRLSVGLKDLLRLEWQVWLGAGERRGLGVVNFAASALMVLAREAGMTVTVDAPTIPAYLRTP